MRVPFCSAGGLLGELLKARGGYNAANVCPIHCSIHFHINSFLLNCGIRKKSSAKHVEPKHEQNVTYLQNTKLNLSCGREREQSIFNRLTRTSVIIVTSTVHMLPTQTFSKFNPSNPSGDSGTKWRKGSWFTSFRLCVRLMYCRSGQNWPLLQSVWASQ